MKDTTESRIRHLMPLTVFMVIVTLIATLMPTSAHAADPVTGMVGDKIVYSCDAPTTFTDGTPIPAGTNVTIRAYATQNPPEVGQPIGSGKCPITVDSSGLSPGLWQAYVSAFVAGRAEGALSAAVPFVLTPDATVAPGEVENFQVDLIPQ